MFLLEFLLFCCFLEHIQCPDPRIVGGTTVENRADFPYQALLLYNNAPFCGGTIIDNSHVLTAAHCCLENNGDVIKASKLSVVVGNLLINDYTNKKSVQTVIVHENYNSNTYDNDIALLNISGTFTYTADIQKLSLNTDFITSGSCNVSGWGTVSSNIQIMNDNLLYVEVPVVNLTTCSNAYGELSDTKICAGVVGKDSCQGDSGGPLVCSGKLAGIVSNGYDCGKKNFPGVYTAVAKYTKWIEEAKLRSSSFTNVANLFVISLVLIKTFLM